MSRRSLLALTVVLFALALIGCGPPWVVVMQTTPNSLVNAPRFSVLPIDFTGLEIGGESLFTDDVDSVPESVFLSEKSPETQQSFAADKAAINENFTKLLMSRVQAAGVEVVLGMGPADAPFQIRPSIKWLRPGVFAVVYRSHSEVRMTLRITTPDGRVLDEITMKSRTPTSLANASSGDRLRTDAGWLGLNAANYVRSRVHPEK
jgi:hypothetical protein